MTLKLRTTIPQRNLNGLHTDTINVDDDALLRKLKGKMFAITTNYKMNKLLGLKIIDVLQFQTKNRFG